MKTKIFFFDLDGTLLNSNKQITPDTYAALCEWHDAGNLIAINSGRPLISILKVIDELKLSAFMPYAVAFNGALIYSVKDKKTIIKKGISLNDVADIYSAARSLSLHCHSYNDNAILTPAVNDEIRYYTRVVKLPVDVLERFPEGINDPPCKMLCIDLTESDKLDKMTDLINSGEFSTGRAAGPARLYAMRSNSRYLEIIPSDAGKGTAVRELAAYLGIDEGGSLAAGDEENDLSMIEAAGCGVAMCNGNKDIFASADIITVKDNDHDGLAPIIRQHIHKI